MSEELKYNLLLSTIFAGKTPEVINRNAAVTVINKAISSLNSREQEIIAMRFDLAGGTRKTLQQIGDHFGVSRERIRQVERKIIRKLKHPTRTKELMQHLSFSGADSR